MHKIVLLRHGESVWNRQGLFTGWTDVALSPAGIAEARAAGRELKRRGFVFDRAWYSYLQRTRQTLRLVLAEMGSPRLPAEADWRLNERHYGDLQGLNKAEMARKFGLDQVFRWRRGYDVHPPQITASNPYDQRDDKKYKGIRVPRGESLKDVVARVVPFWREEIRPELKQDEMILIVASGNSLRALIKYLDQVPARDIVKLNIPLAIPLVYELDDDLRPLRRYYLADRKRLAAASKRAGGASRTGN